MPLTLHQPTGNQNAGHHCGLIEYTNTETAS